MQTALLRELELQRDFFGGEKLDSLYFGGGSPSLINDQAIAELIGAVKRIFPCNAEMEVTLEANPDDISAAKVQALAAAGINRLSIGIQSFFDEDLRYMNRGHDAAQAEQCIQIAIDHGISNLSIDLIFGFTALSMEKWVTNIDKALQYPIQHISCYGITVEPKTALASMIARKKTTAPDEELSSQQYSYLIKRLQNAGFEHYEISNFARKGFRAKHNSSYWQSKPYLGIGPSAHSFRRNTRQWNIANNALYIKQIATGIIPCETETLSLTEQWNEKIMISLRTSDGLPLADFESNLPEQERSIFNKRVKEYCSQSMLRADDDGHLRLTDQGKLFADGIAAALFF